MRGDVTDVSSKMRGVQTSIDGVSKAAGNSHASMGRLGQEMVTLTRRMLGLNPVVAQASNVLGGLAIGSGPMIGILAGVSAVGFAINKLTESSRNAMDAADKLVVSYNQMAKISALGIAGQQKADIDTINKGLEEHSKWLSAIIALRAQLGSVGGLLSGLQGSQSTAITSGTAARAAAEQQKVNAIGLQNAKDNEAWAARVKAENEKAVRDAEKAQADAIRYREMMRNAYGPDAAIRGPRSTWRASPQSMTDEERAALAGALGPGGVPDTAIPLTEIHKQIDELKKGREDAKQHAQDIHDAIWGSAAALANSIVSSLNIGGGGKGSNLGGAIGGTAGFALGFGATSFFGGGAIGGAIGSTIGNVLGSLVGGLFDHNTKAVNQNTAAVDRNTAALLLNAPSGFKIANARYNATDVSEMGRATRRYVSRGGVNPLLVGT